MFTSNNPGVVNQLPLSVDLPEKYEDFTKIYVNLYKRMVNSINSKEGGLYDLQELLNFNQLYTIGNPQSFRNVYRYTYDVVSQNGGPVGGGATVTFANNITGLVQPTLIYATCKSAAGASFTVTYPYAQLQGANVVFTNPIGGTTLTYVMFVAEYTKN